MRRARLWAESGKTKPDGKAFHVSELPGFKKDRKWKTDDRWVHLICTSCDKETQPVCSWRGWSVYNAAIQTWQMHASGAHGAKETKGKCAATAEQEEKLMASKARNVQARLVALNSVDMTPPDKKQARSLRTNKRFREKLRQGGKETLPEEHKEEWTVEDVTEALRKHTTHAIDTDPSSLDVDPDKLLLLGVHQLVAERKRKTGFAALLSAKELLATPKQLANLRYIKGPSDATFRELFGSWCTVNMGVLTKHLGETVIDSHEEYIHKATTWATTYPPFVYVMASSEAGPAVELGFKVMGEIKLDEIKLDSADASRLGEATGKRQASGSLSHGVCQGLPTCN